MEQPIKIELTFNNVNDVIGGLLTALQYQNSENAKFKAKFAQFENVINEKRERIDELNAQLNEKVNCINDLNTSLNEDVQRIGFLEKENSEKDKQIENVKTCSDQLKCKYKELERSYEDSKNSRNWLEKEKSELEKKLNQLTQELKTTSELLGEEKSKVENLSKKLNKLNIERRNSIKECLTMVDGYLREDLAKLADHHPLRKYSMRIINPDVEGYAALAAIDADNVASVLEKADSALSRLANLTWWFALAPLKVDMENILPHIDRITGIYRYYFIPLLKKVLDIQINLPDTSFSSQIAQYGLYENGSTRINEIFPSAVLENAKVSKYDLCEIYQLSMNDRLGRCYVYS